MRIFIFKRSLSSKLASPANLTQSSARNAVMEELGGGGQEGQMLADQFNQYAAIPVPLDFQNFRRPCQHITMLPLFRRPCINICAAPA